MECRACWYSKCTSNAATPGNTAESRQWVFRLLIIGSLYAPEPSLRSLWSCQWLHMRCTTEKHVIFYCVVYLCFLNLLFVKPFLYFLGLCLHFLLRFWIIFTIIILNSFSGRYHLYVESKKKWYKWKYLQNRSRVIDVKTNLWLLGWAEGRGRGINWEIEIYTLLHTK